MTYDQAFFDSQQGGSLSSAWHVLPDLIRRIRVVKGSGQTADMKVIDVGCGVGTWLRVADAMGCEIHGVDGYAENIMIPEETFERRDLNGGVDCSGYDLALCMEVAEHLPESDAMALVNGLARAKYVLFSPAHPGQGGVNHVNERWGTWWASKFLAHDMVGSSDLKWQHWENLEIEDFYRENVILFTDPILMNALKMRHGVVDVIHPQRLGQWHGE